MYSRWRCKSSVGYVNNVNDDTRKWKINHSCFFCFHVENSSSSAFVFRPASGKKTASSNSSNSKQSYSTTFREYNMATTPRASCYNKEKDWWLGIFHSSVPSSWLIVSWQITMTVKLEIFHKFQFQPNCFPRLKADVCGNIILLDSCLTERKMRNLMPVMGLHNKRRGDNI